uniref:Zinc finger protein 827 n=1 Tax=Paramormyrops kingsleyae TaxID=1676925 RepID=A0A3B3T5A8_9TELE|nr:zinc finger protein 827-like isoform X2 [Paramormyrops kingsleyae]
MPRRKQEQPQRLAAHLERAEDGEAEPVGGGSWFGHASDTPSEDDIQPSPEGGPPEQDTSGESSVGCPTPVPRASLDLQGLDSDSFHVGSFTVQDTLSSVVSSLYGDHALGAPLSSNLRRLLEADSLRLDVGGLVDRDRSQDTSSLHLDSALSPSSRHAQQLSALARKLAKSSASMTASPTPTASVSAVKRELSEPFAGANGNSFAWVGGGETWLPAGGSAPGGSSLSPDSAIQKLKAAANAVRQDKSAGASLAVSSSSSSSSSSGVIGGGRADEPARFDAFPSPFNSQSASSTLAALSKKVSERGLQQGEPSANCSFFSLVSMTPSAALLKEVAVRAAKNLLGSQREQVTAAESLGDGEPLADSDQKLSTARRSADPPPSPPKGKVKASSQEVPPEDGGRPFQCPVCGLVIKRKSYWKRHMVIHTGLKSHQCPLCPFRCARKDNLKSHMKVHQHQDRGETFQCPLCPFTSSRHFSLKLHMRCHQHFPRAELRVKQEASSDGESKDRGGSPASADSSLRPSPRDPGEHVRVKEEPQESHVSGASPFSLCAPSDQATPKSGPPTPLTTLFGTDITTKSASDLLIKLSAANQKEAQKSRFFVKQEEDEEEEEQSEEESSPRPALGQPGQPFCQADGRLLGQNMGVKVASEFLMKLSENKREPCNSHGAPVKAEPMDLDPPGLTPLASSCLLPSDEPLTGLPAGPLCPQKALFSQDISVKMASELLYKLSEKVSKAKECRDSSIMGMARPYSKEPCRQSLYSSGSLSSDTGSSTRASLQGWVKLTGDAGNGASLWRANEQLYPCPVCGKVFGRRQTLSRHLSQHIGERRYGCHLCPYVAKCRSNLKQHLAVHCGKLRGSNGPAPNPSGGSPCRDSPYYYSCHVCGFEVELGVQFNGHMSLHGEQQRCMFSLCCRSCGFTCIEEADMKAHVHTEHAGCSSRSPLSETKSTSSSLSALSDSISGSESGDVAHGNDGLQGLLATPPSADSHSGSGTEERTEKGFECVFCNFVCKTRAMQERHVEAHLLARGCECDICHKLMDSPEQLREHKKCHVLPTTRLKFPYPTEQPASAMLPPECRKQTEQRRGRTRKGSQRELRLQECEQRVHGCPGPEADPSLPRGPLCCVRHAFAHGHRDGEPPEKHRRRRGCKRSGRLSPTGGVGVSSVSVSAPRIPLSVTAKRPPGIGPALCYLLRQGSCSSVPHGTYFGSELAHLVPLSHCSTLPASRIRPASRTSLSHPLSPKSLKHSFLAYLGLEAV